MAVGILDPRKGVLWNNDPLSEEQIARQRMIADALIAQNSAAQPIDHWTQGAAQVLGTLGGILRDRRADQAEASNVDYNKSLVDALLSRSSGSSSATALPMSGTGSELSETAPASGAANGSAQSYRDAIASIESAGSGDYAAIGPRHPKMGRALGRYQVMESNIGPWSMEALGREVTPDEFMADPAIQDAIFDNQFGKYVQKYGPEGAAQAWFGGEGGVGKLGRKDVLGTSIGGYGKKFLNALGGQEVASLDPSSAIADGAIVPGAEPIVPMEGEGTPTATTGRDAIAQALAAQGGQQEVAQAATGQQNGGINADLLRAMADPRANAGTRSIIQALMQQQEAAQQQRAQRDNWLYQQQYEEQRQARDPLRQAQIEKMQREAANPASDESFFGNPVAVQNQDGSISYGQIGNRGSFKPIQLGDGQSFAPPTRTIDAGTENVIVDQAGNVISRVPKNLAEAESEKARGKAQGDAIASLPGDMQQAEATVSQIDSLLGHKGLDAIVGPLDQYRGKTFLGGEGRDALARLEQLQGGAFLQAYGLLKGGGQITEIEGIKAERAMARMDRALDEADFKAALRDFREAVSTGADKLRQKAGLPAREAGAANKPLSEMTDEELEALANGQ